MDALNPQTVVTNFNNKIEDSVTNFFTKIDTYAYMAFRKQAQYLLIPFIPSGTGHILFYNQKEEHSMVKLFTIPSTNIKKIPIMFEVVNDAEFYNYQQLNAMTYATTTLGYLLYVEKDGFLSDFSEETILERCFDYTVCAIYNLLLLSCHSGYSDNPARAAQIVWNTLCYQTGTQHLSQNYENVVHAALEILHKEGMRPSDLQKDKEYDDDVWQDIKMQFEGDNGHEEDNTISTNDDGVIGSK